MKYLIPSLIALLCPVFSHGQAVLSQGQISFLEVGFNNSNISNPFWTVQINDESTLTLYEASFSSSLGRFVFDAPGGARFFVAGPHHLYHRPLPANWSFVGVGPDQLFRATPQNGDPSIQLVLGVATIGVPNGILVDNQIAITMSVAGISNPGQFSYYSNDDPPNSALGNLGTILLSTQNNLVSFDRDTGTQNNFNMAFSAGGVYHVDFQISGTRTEAAGGGLITSPFYRYTFEVAPFASVPEPGTWALLGSALPLAAFTLWRLRHRRKKFLETDVA